MVKDKKKKAEKTEEKENAQETESTQETEKQKKKPKEGGGRLITVLTILLLLVGVGELALLVFMGVGVYRGRLAQQAYEAQLSATDSTPAAVSVVSYAGPWLTLENGRLTWRREDELSGVGVSGSGAVSSGQTGTGTSQTEYPLTPAAPPRSWVWTIDSDIA